MEGRCKGGRERWPHFSRDLRCYRRSSSDGSSDRGRVHLCCVPFLTEAAPGLSLRRNGVPPAKVSAFRRGFRSRGAAGEPEVAASRSVTHPTRLETRTKESKACASSRDLNRPESAMKVKGDLTSSELGSVPNLLGAAHQRPVLRRSRRGGARAYALGPERW